MIARLRELRALRTPALLLAAIAVAEFSTPRLPGARALTLVLAALLTSRYLTQSLHHIRLAARVRGALRARALELALTAAAVALLVSKASVWVRELADPAGRATLDPVYRQYAIAFIVVAGLRLLIGDFSARRALHRLELRPAQTVALGFAGAILGGALLLAMPVSLARLEELSLLDVLFTATSAVTTTGLSSYDVGSFHTRFGQAVLLALIQVGGLGTMAATASLVILAGRRLRLTQAAALQENMDLETMGEVRSRLKTILAVTAAIEAAGAVLLWLAWRGRADLDAVPFLALFHAVSAFCTAGFSLFPDNLSAFRNDALTQAIIGALMLAGALGIPVLRDLARLAAALRHRRHVPVLTLHSRVALVTTGALLAGGAILALGFELGGASGPVPGPTHLLDAVFLSATTQSTTGFNAIDTGGLTPATLWVLMLLMFIGGSPGSTAGGIKTTTAAAVGATVWATLRGRARVEAFRRTIPEEQLAKALALVGVSAATVALGVIIVLATQAGAPLALTFEVVSAFGTVGLSTGLTPTLDGWGKLALIGLMFVGRTGPLTLGFALAARRSPARIVYPAEKIMLG